MNEKSTTLNPEQTREATSGGVADTVKRTAGSAAAHAREGLGQELEQRKGRASETMGSVAQAIRETGDKLGGGATPIASKAAERVDRAARYLESRDVRDMISGVEGFARREPALFLGGAFALGLFAGRFLKSSSRGGASETGEESYDEPFYLEEEEEVRLGAGAFPEEYGPGGEELTPTGGFGMEKDIAGDGGQTGRGGEG